MDDLQQRIDELEELGLHRRMRMISGPQGPRVVLDGKPVLLLCSNNYLGLADHPRVREAAADAAMRWGVGSGSSRLVSGNMTLHRRLEERLAEFKGTASAVLFGSGYLANIGVIPALARKGEVVFSDELNHASIIDGCRLAGADTFVYRHGDMDHLAWGLRQSEKRGALIATDGVFSMDGDVAPLEQIVELARRHGVRVMVDDAHGTGCVGPEGRGSVAAAGLEEEVDVLVGAAGSTTQIMPLIVGGAAAAVRVAEAALEQGVFAQAIRPPTVPEGTSRLRLAVMASHTRGELREAAHVLARAAREASVGSAASVREPLSRPLNREGLNCVGALPDMAHRRED
jgi:glycine C-acetyltransferase/8-amino-7-oxononanoate synthase